MEVQLITEPSVYLVGKQIVADEELTRFLHDHGVNWNSDSEIPAEILTESAGRICYMSFAKPRPGGNSVYLQHIKESGHGSVLEHGVWNFVFTGISRSLTHELIRHRAGMGYSQLSQRYVDESVAEYVEPDVIAKDPELHAIWLEAIGKMHQAYVTLSEKLLGKFTHEAEKTARRKHARQAARSILPNATETKIFVTANARALRHFMEQRGSRHAEPEIRKLANRVLDVLQKDSPNLFGDYTREDLGDGTFEINTIYRKV